MKKNNMDFETTVLDYLSRHLYERRERLIEYLMKSHPDDTGYSEASINRKLANMRKNNLILIERDPDVLALYGIKKEAENASYIIDKSAGEILKHLNYVFKKYETGEIIDKKVSLKDMSKYGMTSFLSSSHLNIMVSDLDKEDDGLINILLEILYHQIINKGNKPDNKEIFLENLRNLLSKYPEEHEKYTMIRRRVIRLLGYYNDKAVLKQLKADIEAGRLSETKEDYWDRFTARVIEDGRTELFDLEIYLRKEGNTEAADTLVEIRNQAFAKARNSKDSDLPWEAAVSSTLPVDKKLPKVITKLNEALK
ncbi:hypothetical protein FXV91_09800 [Methanosarcina sp. DH2]|nr:hypothetical protein [Methanosarcina sp. DH2]